MVRNPALTGTGGPRPEIEADGGGDASGLPKAPKPFRMQLPLRRQGCVGKVGPRPC